MPAAVTVVAKAKCLYGVPPDVPAAALTAASSILFRRRAALRGSDANVVYLPNYLSQIAKIDQFSNLDQTRL